jgi:hypothetical protein
MDAMQRMFGGESPRSNIRHKFPHIYGGMCVVIGGRQGLTP